MRERPIIFSGPMVRAILDGRKTQTRRIAKKAVRHPDFGNIYTPGALVLEREPQHVIERACPFGQPRDRLWVREAFSGPYIMEGTEDIPAVPPGQWPHDSPIWYWADGDPEKGDWTRPRPSIHMPRWASRITLEITSVRVERLQDISEDDAAAEGAWFELREIDGVRLGAVASHRAGFERLWQSIHGINSWHVNPFVWVVEFRRIEQ